MTWLDSYNGKAHGVLFGTDHVRKNRNFNKREPTRFIQIDSLPMTATSEDIRKLAREALPDGDKAIQECKWDGILAFSGGPV